MNLDHCYDQIEFTQCVKHVNVFFTCITTHVLYNISLQSLMIQLMAENISVE